MSELTVLLPPRFLSLTRRFLNCSPTRRSSLVRRAFAEQIPFQA